MEILKEAAKLQGKIGIYYKNLKSGKKITSLENEKFISASTIKLPMLCAVYKMVHENRTSFDSKVKVSYDKRVPSCGAFNSFTDEPIVDIRTLCKLMITISDNTAANIIMEYFGIETLNQEFRDMGMKETHLERLFYDDEKQAEGFDNRIVPWEMGVLLERLYNGEIISKDASRDILTVLKEQQIRHLIPTYIEDYTEVGNKTGSARGITCDSAIIFGDNPFVYVVISNDTFVPDTDEFIRKSAKYLYEEVKG